MSYFPASAHFEDSTRADENLEGIAYRITVRVHNAVGLKLANHVSEALSVKLDSVCCLKHVAVDLVLHGIEKADDAGLDVFGAFVDASAKGHCVVGIAILFVQNLAEQDIDDPKQNVSEEIYEDSKQDVRAGDIFVVRDGTYLVGISCILTEKDTKILYCGGLYKLRIEKLEKMDPYLLLALLNAPIVRRQMRAKQFTRDIIDTLGKRLFEVLLPIPKDSGMCDRIAKETRDVIETRAKLHDRTKEIALEVEGLDMASAVDIEGLEQS